MKSHSLVKLLLKLGANPDKMHSEMACAPLHLAASNEFLGIVNALIDAKANVDCEDPRGTKFLCLITTLRLHSIVDGRN